jgi:hypothetical protein
VSLIGNVGPQIIVASSGGFPNALNTGFRGSLTAAGSNTISSPGTYSGLSFTGGVSIASSNVTLIDCLITGLATDTVELFVNSGLTGILISHCTIIGNVSNSNIGVLGIQTVGDAVACGVEVAFCDISHCECVEVGAGPLYIHDCYFHDLGNASGDLTHWECIYYGGNAHGNGSFTLNIQHNTLLNPLTQTAAIFLEDFFGAATGITINNNFLSCGATSGSGGYDLYMAGNQGAGGVVATVTNNAFQKKFSTLNYSALAVPFTLTQSGNYDADTLAPITLS